MARQQAQLQTETKQQPSKSALHQEIDAAKLVEQVLNLTITQAYRAIDSALQQRIDRVEELLPDALRGQAPRLVRRAMLTFSRKPELQRCTPQSFIRCVLEAAELGLAIDGRLGHAVPFKNKVKDAEGREKWIEEAQFIPDYKGLIAVAKRSGLIRDCYGDVICQNDAFEAYRQDGESRLRHTRDYRRPRGDVYAAYAVLILPDKSWRFEVMDLEELHHVRAKSKSFAKGYGPWVSDEREMLKKTVIRRALKLYAEDPAIVRALELDEDREDLLTPEKPPVEFPLGRHHTGNGRHMPEQPVTSEDGSPQQTTAESTGKGGDQADAKAEEIVLSLRDSVEQANSLQELERVRIQLDKDKELVGPQTYDHFVANFLQPKQRQLEKAAGRIGGPDDGDF